MPKPTVCGHAIMFLLLLGTLTLLPAAALAVQANPDPVDTTQPDGTPLTVRLFGDEWYHFYETDDGHAIVQAPDGWWWYATLDRDGRYTASPYRVGKPDPGLDQFLQDIGPHLREHTQYWTENRERFLTHTMPGILENAAKLDQGRRATLNVPVVLIQYPDFFASQSAASFSDMMTLSGYNGTGSFDDYYQEVSYGALSINATIYGWYTAPNFRSYYAHGSGSIAELNRARQLVRSAIDNAESGGAGWGPFDNDSDGNVDVVFIVHQGLGAECGNTNFIWSHHWYLNAAGSNYSVTYDGKLIDRYIIQPELSCGGGHIEIGVFCHEFGHALGMPDLYDIDGSSEGIGNWCLMAGGAWGGNGTSPQKPAHMSAWCKMDLGWVTPTVVASNTTGASISDVETTGQVYQLWTNGTPATEYFLVENRQKTGFDSNLFTGGLAIWHIDMSQRKTDNTDNANEAHKLVDLEEADGLAHLDSGSNRGDAGDLYPGSAVNRSFDGGTNPNSHDYAAAPTFVCVDNVSNSASTMTADFCVTTAGSPDLVIRDCAADVGAEPDVPCAQNWVQSLDIWVDNNDDGIIDAPIKGVVNHLYIRSWNLGAATTNAKIKCWYVNPSLGLNFGLGSPGTQITDAFSFATELTIPSMSTSLPSPGGAGYRAYFNWLIPNPPPNIDHYCIGCVIENLSDPQISPVPVQENNLGQINYWALALKAGTTPARIPGNIALRGDETIFRQDVRVVNSFEEPKEFLIRVEGLEETDYLILPAPELTLNLPPFAEEVITFDLIKPAANHGDTAQVRFRMFTLPDMNPVGGLVNDLSIDNFEPQEVDNWSVDYFRPQGDNYPRPSPKYVVSWDAPAFDVAGFPETVRSFEIYGSPEPDSLLDPGPGVLLQLTGEDDDLTKPGYQYYVHVPNDDESDWYFTMRARDLANNPGLLSPIRNAPPIAAEVPEGPVDHESWLQSSSPNPFRGNTTIVFRSDGAEPVELDVFDLGGRLVKRLADGVFAAGDHAVAWNGRDNAAGRLPAGTYLVRYQSGSREESRKITLLE